MPTARSIIRGALTDLGVAGAEQPMDASMAEDALDLLNQLLDSLSLERLLVYYLPPEALVWPPGVPLQTWGLGGDIPSERPLRLEPPVMLTDPHSAQVEWEIALLTPAQYQEVAMKGLPNADPQALSYAPQMPLGEVRVWPVPTVQVTLTVRPWRVLGQFVALDDEILFPPGYARMLRTNLALEASPSYSVQPSPLLVRAAAESKSALAPLNAEIGRLRLDAGRPQRWGGLVAFYSGGMA
jgi:hypothetical protein